MKKTFTDGVVALAILIILIGIPTLVYFLAKGSEKANEYPQTMIVTEVKNNVVTIETATGYQYQFEGAEDWEVGDFCSCIMNSKGTETIFDDEIVQTRYSGWFK